jgi:hypothetical protein
MKNKKLVLCIGLAVIILISLFAYFGNSTRLSGYATLGEDDVGNETKISEQQAQDALNESRGMIEKMLENDFSVDFMNDTLTEAERIFEQIKFAEVLRDDSSSYFEKKEARETLALIDWQDLSYNDVIVKTDLIKSRLDQSFILFDSIGAIKITVEEYYGKEIGEISDKESVRLIAEAEKAFYEDRYEDSGGLITQSRDALELEKSETTRFNTIKNGTKTFIQKNWYYVLAILIILSVLVYISYKKVNKKILKGKIRKMKLESKVLVDLMKKAQTERFKENKISGLVYNTRMKKYKERQQEIKEKLPVLEGNIKKDKKVSKKEVKKK